MPSGVIVSFETAAVVILILVALPIVYWLILALTGRLGRRQR